MWLKGQVKAVPPLELSSRLCGTLSRATGKSLKARRQKKKKRKQASRDRAHGRSALYSWMRSDRMSSTWPSGYWVISLTQCQRVWIQAAWQRDRALWSTPNVRKPESEHLSDSLSFVYLAFCRNTMTVTQTDNRHPSTWAYSHDEFCMHWCLNICVCVCVCRPLTV